MRFDSWAFPENLSRKCRFLQNLTRITGILHKDVDTFMMSRWILFRMRNVLEISCRENQNTNFMFNNFFLPPRKSCRLWDNVEKCIGARQATDDCITRRMRFACWITNTINTNLEHVILTAFPRQQWLKKSPLCYIIRILSALLRSSMEVWHV